MANPWFLDLDGAKSGPYQTQEVLSLVAEGEVLPHHLISPTLKDGPWISVLEWRLSQANLVPKPVPAADVPSPTLTSQPSYKPAQPSPPVQAIHSPLNTPAPYTPPENVIKKDPAAEMFDALHQSKQKREEKQIQAEKAHAASAQTDIYSTTSTQAASPRKNDTSGGSGTFIRTVLAGVAISAFGFWLGQWFQKSAAPHTQAPAPIAAATPAATVSATATPVETVAILQDRSTDKITIRGRVAPKLATLPANGAGTLNAAPGQPTGNAEPEASPAVGTKDLKELQDLKKELQELKNLKEELKNSIHDDGFDEGADLPENGAGEPTNPDSNSRY